jgi:hypothetical protein
MDLKSVLTLVGQACGSEEWLATHHPDSLLACHGHYRQSSCLSAIHVDLKSGRRT